MIDPARPSPFTLTEEPQTPPRSTDLRAAVSVFGALVVIGAVLGLVWSAWSPPGPRAIILAPGAIQADETEAWIAADGRYLVLTVAAGLVAAVLAWTRVRDRGVPMLIALAGGGLAGAALTWLVGRLVGGGTYDGKPNTLIEQLPLTVHATGLVFLQAGVAVLVYGLLVAFAARDDLGRADPVRDRLLAARSQPVQYPPPTYPPPAYPPPAYPPPSVGAGHQPQDSGRDGDAPGLLQKRDLPPQ